MFDNLKAKAQVSFLVLQVAGFDEEDGGASPSHKKGSRAGRREGRVKSKGGADGEPGAAIAGATLRMSNWPPNDQEVANTAIEEAVPVTVFQYSSMHCVAASPRAVLQSESRRVLPFDLE